MTARTARLALGALACAVALGGCMSSEASFEPLTAKPKPKAQRNQPARVYVDKDSIGGPCNDSRPVAAAQAATTPWCSLDRAVDSAPSGSTILVRRGSYPRLTIQGERRTRFVTIRSAPRETATLNGFTATNSSYWRFQGLRFAGASNLIFMGNDHIDMIGNDLTVATQVRPSLNIRFIDNRVHDLPGPPGRPEDGVGIWVVTGEQGPIRNVLIRGNTFSRLPNDAIFTDADRVTVERNEFDHIQSPDNTWAHADVIQTQGAYDVHVTNNFATDNDSGILNSAAASHGWIIKNNLFIRSESQPIQLDNKLADLELVNNTFWGGGPVLLRWDPAAPRNRHAFVIANNIATRMDIDPRLRESQSHNYVLLDPFHHPAQGPGSRLGVAPHFAAPARGDYRLRSGSPGIDAGTSRNAPRRDRAGNARLGAVDVGAYEYRPHARLGVVSSGVR